MAGFDPLSWLGSAIGGTASAIAGVVQGQQNLQAVHDTNAMNIELANTAIQRRQADLQAAGINPLMAGQIGGAQTPTLQAPQMTGLPQAAEAIGNIPQNAFALQQQQAGIQATQADIDKASAEADAAKALADKTRAETPYVGPQAETHMALEESGTGLNAANKAKAEAETTTINQLRDPQTNAIKADIANTAADTANKQTQQQILKAQADFADAKYGADAKIATTEAAKIATDYKNFFLQRGQNELDTQALTLSLMKSDLGQKLIAQTLAAKYGEQKYLTEMTDTSGKLVSQFGQQVSGYRGRQMMDLSHYGPQGAY